MPPNHRDNLTLSAVVGGKLHSGFGRTGDVVSIREALGAVWRNLVEGRSSDTPRYDHGYQPDAQARAQNAKHAQAEELMHTFLPRLPGHLHGPLEHVVLRSKTPPTDPLSLMNAVSASLTGLGIANERGGVPGEEDLLLYERLGELERWMDRDLGHPEDTQYAVLRRVVARLERDRREGAA